VRINQLTLRDFRGVADRTIAPARSGVTIVQGDNEAGKTSVVEALDLLLDYRDDSNAAAVRAVRPVHADVGAFVEAELSAGPYRFTYAKRFHRDRATTLTVHEPRAEQLTGREAHERVGAILDEHVDRQLWAALRLHQGVELDQADLSEGSSLAAALDAAAGSMLGGDRESTVFDRVRSEYERYYTAKAGRPTRLLAQAEEMANTARDAADTLAMELDRLDADVERHAALSRLIEERRKALAAQRRHAAALDTEAAALERRAEEVERLRLEAELAEGNRDRAAQALAAREALVTEVEAAMLALRQAEAEAASLVAALAEAEAHSAAAAGAVTAARAAVEAAREDQRAAEAARDSLLFHDQLEALADRLARAKRAQEELRAADAVLTGSGVDDDALARIEAAERDLAAAAAALDADAAVVEVNALRDTTTAIDDEAPEALAAGASTSHRVGDRLRLRVGEEAEVVLISGGSSRRRAQRHDDAQLELRTRCRAAGVDDPDAARQAHRVRRDATAAAGRAREQLGAALGDATIQVLTDREARLRERIGGAPRGGVADADAAEDAVRDARKRLDEVEDVIEDHRRTQRRADTALAGRRDEMARAQHALDAATRRRDVTVADLASARAHSGDRALATVLAEQDAALGRARAAYGTASSTLRDRDATDARAEADHAAAVVGRLAEELRSAEDERRDVRVRLELRGEQGVHDAFEAARRTHEHAEREHRRLQAQATAAKLLHDRMAAHRDDARRAYAAPLCDKLERLARIVFGETLRIQLDDDLRIARRTLGGVTLDYDQLSSGAREQLAVLARLAVAGIVGRSSEEDEGGVPLILDDALGYSDPTRLERLGAALRVGARDTQVIVLTCVPERYRHVGDAKVIHL
jgi:hypothetical protein